MNRPALVGMSLGIVLLVCLNSPADDPPLAKAKAKPKAKAKLKVAGRGDEPPACVHDAARAKALRKSSPTMPDMFDRMGQVMANNPTNGFAEVLREQETAALREVAISSREERRIGLAARDEFLRKTAAAGHRESNNPARLNYLKALVETFHRRMKNRARYPEIDVKLIDGPAADGQSFPGGFLVFPSALLDEPDEATVAAVVAHELAHLDRGHLNEYARREKLVETAFRPDANPNLDPSRFMTQGMALGSIMMAPFRPEHEHDADCVATTWLYLEDYSPLALAEFFDRLHRRIRDQPDNEFFQMGRSHPYSLARREAVLKRLVQLQRWKPRDDLGLYANNLRRLTPKPPAP